MNIKFKKFLRERERETSEGGHWGKEFPSGQESAGNVVQFKLRRNRKYENGHKTRKTYKEIESQN